MESISKLYLLYVQYLSKCTTKLLSTTDDRLQRRFVCVKDSPNVLHLTDYTGQDLRRELRLVAVLSSEGVPPALQGVCGQRFSVEKNHQQC